ncbi:MULTISPECIES: asparagine synthase (glutamine-hydrolyzing) [unclassified Desulfovibrio]|uniref:asparagine synthase (glutamine-hydrolyzing) n=1 Tax=unclassified Desulfovibrio TaxID=2593640 RepID=UPI0013EA64CD|nr:MULTISPECIES: asparagine synthase (glutamine-hydrolyzing) [unclassified Desulfovibrio]
MCGITGFYNLAGILPSLENAEGILARMTRVLAHRGPDGEGLWLDADAGIALGHRRLSIRDTSLAGAQPMRSHDGRYVLTYNGEIYNAEDLRREVEAAAGQTIPWRGRSDTEVFLEACAVLGVGRALEQSIGMFAFGLWDARERTLILGRDRFGIKPLYWAVCDNQLLFGSELKALHQHPDFHPDIDRHMLAAFFRSGYLPPPLTLFSGVHQLKPGHLLRVRPGDAPQEEEWWSARKVALAGVANRVRDHRGALDELHALLRDAVSRRLVSDVPIGAFLSGGIDSSLVVALMQEASPTPVRTYSIGFEQAELNEAPYAKAIAEALGTVHTELYVTGEDAIRLIPQLPHIYDGPFADSSQMPTFFLSQLTRRDVTVALSGDGGDELFGGYAQAGCTLPRKIPVGLSRSVFYQRNHFGRWMGLNPVPGGRAPSAYFVQGIADSMLENDAELTQLIDTEHYLPGDILTKVDRASMAVSLEVRPPLLDHRIYALAWRMPPELRRACGKGKWPLRHILDHYVSPVLTDRPKQGFGCPLLLWLRGPLREWAESLLAPDRLRREGWLNPDAVARMWRDTLAGKVYVDGIWAALMFQAWREAQAGAE